MDDVLSELEGLIVAVKERRAAALRRADAAKEVLQALQSATEAMGRLDEVFREEAAELAPTTEASGDDGGGRAVSPGSQAAPRTASAPVGPAERSSSIGAPARVAGEH